jgi:hypothetical protein
MASKTQNTPQLTTRTGPTARECHQLCSWHITNGSNIHDLKSQMKDLNSQEQLSFLKNMACIIPHGEDTLPQIIDLPLKPGQ